MRLLGKAGIGRIVRVGGDQTQSGRPGLTHRLDPLDHEAITVPQHGHLAGCGDTPGGVDDEPVARAHLGLHGVAAEREADYDLGLSFSIGRLLGEALRVSVGSNAVALIKPSPDGESGDTLSATVRALNSAGSQRHHDAVEGDTLRHLRDAAAAPDRAETEREIAFFRKHRHRMRYHALKEEGIAIGSGVVEAANKTLVTQRMKRSGMRWRIVGGQAVLTFRALIKSGRFERAWKALISATDTPANDNISPRAAAMAIAA